ncbi:6368_t:CDS:2, partial [Gigaspora rosea]
IDNDNIEMSDIDLETTSLSEERLPENKNQAIYQNSPDKTELSTTSSECLNTNNTKKRQ